MTIADSRRFEMYDTFRSEFGVAVADTLMEHLPPAGWADVARKSDVDNLNVKVLKDGKPVDGIQVNHGTTSTRLYADNYEITIDGHAEILAGPLGRELTERLA